MRYVHEGALMCPSGDLEEEEDELNGRSENKNNSNEGPLFSIRRARC